MSRPKVTLENYEAVYDFYRDYEPKPNLARVGHAAMSLAFKPQFEIADGAQEAITDLLDNETRLMITVNHLLDTDQYAVASMAHLVPWMRPLIGNTNIPTKQSLSKNPFLRRAIDIMGSVPVYRGSDVYVNGNDSERVRGQRFMATQLYYDTMAYKIDTGKHMASFPEGTRNDTHPRTLLPIKAGLGEIMMRTNPRIQLALLPIGLWYGEDGDCNVRHPSMYISAPIVQEFSSIEMITEIVGNELQLSVDAAIKHFENR